MPPRMIAGGLLWRAPVKIDTGNGPCPNLQCPWVCWFLVLPSVSLAGQSKMQFWFKSVCDRSEAQSIAALTIGI